jgi:sulfate adenylyltransferase large subunit
MDLLRFTTAGSVDDGKSTLIGRLLYDAKALFDDHLANIEATSQKRGFGAAPIDFSLLTDGLIAEREQGITIDVAYRYFASPKRKFIVADTPGHEQYTRNMATGASTADLAIVLVDAVKGVRAQSRRHAAISSLLGLRHLVVAVNKMDAVAYSQARFDELKAELEPVLGKLAFETAQVIPLSALQGDNVVTPSANMPWYGGPTLKEWLESVPVASPRTTPLGLRFFVQRVALPHAQQAAAGRGYQGVVQAGDVAVGDEITVLDDGGQARHSTVTAIGVWQDGATARLPRARAGQAVTLHIADELDVSRGALFTSAVAPARVAQEFRAQVVWMDGTPLQPARPYLLQLGTKTVRARIAAPEAMLDIGTLDAAPAAATLAQNDIGTVQVRTQAPIAHDAYTVSRATGSFILIDEASHATVAAGMILEG